VGSLLDRPVVVGAAVGNIILPGSGAVIGGALGGATTSRHKGNLFKNSLKGAALGTAWGSLAPSVGGFMGIPQGGMAGKAMGVGSPGLMSGLFGGAGATGTGTGAGATAATSGLGNILGGGGLKGLLGPALLATTVMGGLKGKSSYKPYEGPTVSQMMAQHGVSKHPVVPVRRAKPPQDKQVSLAHLQPFNPGMIEQQYFRPEGEFEGYAQGGTVRNAYMRGGDGGQADTVDVEMPEGSYVQDATTISLYGDGGSEAGNLRLNQLKDKFIKAALDHGYQPGHERMMPAKVSHEEAIWPPEAVYGAGLLIEGDPKKGVMVLDRFRDNLRKQKGLKKFLPPKSKSADYYLE